MLTLCNDPKCGLIKQGVPHEDHETIQSKEIKNSCLDGRCAMNRMGVLHKSHDEAPQEIQVED